MTARLSGSRSVTNAPYIRRNSAWSLGINVIMLLTFIIARLRAKPAYVWKPAVTLTDPRIVSELAESLN